MKTISFMVKTSDVKSRNHRALFDANLPFRPRSQKDRTQYQRKPKHQVSKSYWAD